MIQKIYQHATEEGWLWPGATIIDPFAGTGLGGHDAGLAGYQFLGVELEPRFVTLANGGECAGDVDKHEACTNAEEHGPHHLLGNLELWQRKYGQLPQWKQPILLQGDSRELGKIIEAHADLLVSSSPYNSGTVHDKGQDGKQYRRTGPDGYCWGTTANGRFETEAYSHNPENLGNLPPGSLDATLVASSPPYANGCTHTGGVDPQPQHIAGGPLRYVQYGVDCTVSSAPFHTQEPVNDTLWFQRHGQGIGRNPHAPGGTPGHYGVSAGQLAAMPPGDVTAVVQGDCAITSPVYEASLEGHAGSKHHTSSPTSVMKKARAGRTCQDMNYLGAKENLGNTQGDTFWSAAREIVSQTYAILKPGGHAIWVTKRYVRDGKIVNFSQDWARLCEACGFELLHWHKAMLVDHYGEQGTLTGGTDTITVEKKSFFRKLSEKKGSPKIDYEDVLCFVKK